jgi:hypothetical protein
MALNPESPHIRQELFEIRLREPTKPRLSLIGR